MDTVRTLPAGVLANSQYDKFLAAVSAGKKNYSGSVVFSCGKKRFEVKRDANGGFTLLEGAKTLTDKEAKERLVALLGLDAEAFVRVALLHQSRIRGLLMDEAKDRNAALDKLLGTDSASGLSSILKPKAFSAAAGEWRAIVKLREQDYKAKIELLAEQLEEARERARSFGFRNKDFTIDGLESSFKSVWQAIEKIAKQHAVSIDDFSGCATLSSASTTTQRVSEAISKVRRRSSIQNLLANAKVELGEILALQKKWVAALKERELAVTAAREYVKQHGTADKLATDLKALRGDVSKAKDRLKNTNALRTLLMDAYDLLSVSSLANCPVCESGLPDRQTIAESIRKRANRLATGDIKEIEGSIKEMQKTEQLIEQRLTELSSLDATVRTRREATDKLTEQVVKTLRLAASTEKAIASKLEESEKACTEKIDKLSDSVQDLEEGLSGIEARHAGIRDGLLAVLKKREEIARAEKKVQN